MLESYSTDFVNPDKVSANTKKMVVYGIPKSRLWNADGKYQQLFEYRKTNGDIVHKSEANYLGYGDPEGRQSHLTKSKNMGRCTQYMDYLAKNFRPSTSYKHYLVTTRLAPIQYAELRSRNPNRAFIASGRKKKTFGEYRFDKYAMPSKCTRGSELTYENFDYQTAKDTALLSYGAREFCMAVTISAKMTDSNPHRVVFAFYPESKTIHVFESLGFKPINSGENKSGDTFIEENYVTAYQVRALLNTFKWPHSVAWKMEKLDTSRAANDFYDELKKTYGDTPKIAVDDNESPALAPFSKKHVVGYMAFNDDAAGTEQKRAAFQFLPKSQTSATRMVRLPILSTSTDESLNGWKVWINSAGFSSNQRYSPEMHISGGECSWSAAWAITQWMAEYDEDAERLHPEGENHLSVRQFARNWHKWSDDEKKKKTNSKYKQVTSMPYLPLKYMTLQHTAYDDWYDRMHKKALRLTNAINEDMRSPMTTEEYSRQHPEDQKKLFLIMEKPKNARDAEFTAAAEQFVHRPALRKKSKPVPREVQALRDGMGPPEITPTGSEETPPADDEPVGQRRRRSRRAAAAQAMSQMRGASLAFSIHFS